MAGCCSGARRVIIEATVLRVDGETCDRCGDTLDAVRTAASELEAELASLNVSVMLVEHSTTSERLKDSNTVLVNGRPLESLIGAERVSTECASCGDLVGASVCCGATSVDGAISEAVTVNQVRDAVFAALGTDDGCGCG